ncbi:EstA family serine hydrolase [Catenuloplanes japonicus]|uniref:EstA family serine hydrolase n=1 Tax=Catenuloplanes japonicus TaxID=33876 RepID=UPI0005273060|nr:EstA family serine hydrolase [Catenuloplanes japonicus]
MGFESVREMFENNLAGGDEVGAAFCAIVDGETVVDLHGGHADPGRTRPWDRDTIVNVYSATKTISALTALLVVDSFEDPVARYWPEFAANGKQDITLAQVMSHSSGMSGWRAPLVTEDLYDWEKCTSLLAAQEPLWEPGTAIGYHAVTQGYLIGEVIRRITGESLGTVFRTRIAEPHGIDFHIGLPATEDARVAELIPPANPPFQGVPLTEIQDITANNPPMPPSITATRAWRAAEIPAGNGHGNARSLAQALAILADGGRDLISREAVRRAATQHSAGTDLMLGIPLRWGLGFALGSDFLPPNTLFWGGLGGAFVAVDLDRHAAFAYVMNNMGGDVGDMRGLLLSLATWKALDS